MVVPIQHYKNCLSTHLATCPMLPFPARGRITYDPDTNVATHSCDPGYAPSVTERTCQSNNEWSGTTVTCERMEKICVSGGVLTNGCLYTYNYHVSTTHKT